jgi:hypothetical protein
MDTLVESKATLTISGATPLAAGPLIFKRRSLAGSLIGGIRETQEMLDFCGRHEIAADAGVDPRPGLQAHAHERPALAHRVDLASLKIGRSLAA